MLFRPPNTLSVLLDISHQRYGNKRLLDLVKKSLIELVKDLEEEDLFYLYLPEAVDMQRNRGQRVAAIANYDTDGLKFDLITAMKQTLYVTASGDPDGDRTIVFITDRLDSSRVLGLERSIMINIRDDFDLHFVLVGIGQNYDRAVLSKLCETSMATSFHVDDPTAIASLLSYLKPEDHAITDHPLSEPETT